MDPTVRRRTTAPARRRRTMAWLVVAVALIGSLLSPAGAAAPAPASGGGEHTQLVGPTRIDSVAALALVIVDARGDGNLMACTGTLIHREWVITAAACVENTSTRGSITIRFGDRAETEVAVTRIAIDPLHESGSAVRNSVALLGLERQVRIRPIPLANDPAVTARDRPIDVSGRGTTCDGCQDIATRTGRATLIADDDVADILEEINYIDERPSRVHLERLMLTRGQVGLCTFDTGAAISTPGGQSRLVGVAINGIVTVGAPACTGHRGEQWVFAVDLVTSRTGRWVRATAKNSPRARCGGRTATIVGTNSADIVLGTDRGDVIVTRGGDDRVHAGGGDDVVCTAAGADIIDGGSGRDICIGGKGRDRATACEVRRQIP